MRPALAALLLCALTAAPAFAAGEPVTTSDELGETNPEEMTMNALVGRAARGEVSLVVCATGYPATKSGRHANARVLFEACVKAGYTQAMTWMSYMEDNGFGGPESPDGAAHYDRMAAEAGDAVGMFNYGLDLMRGRGVARDDAAGRRLVDGAADKGLAVARRLQGAGYDLDEVTPDADNWKYQPLF